MRFLMFTGQGSQWVGMAKAFYDNFDVAKDIVREADKVLGFKLSDIMFNGPEEKLTLTENAQPAILVNSICIFNVLKNEIGFDFDLCAGHSLGEYSALVASGSLEFGDAVFAVYNRGKFMQEAVEDGIGGMSAVITTDHDAVSEICKNVSKKAGYYCEIANYNARNQIIISGYKKGISEVSSMIKEKKLGKTVPLPVSAPFHCKLMEPVREKMSKVLDDIRVEKPEKPIIENVYSDVMVDKDNIKGYLIDQITMPVKWMFNVEKAVDLGANDFVEVGPKNILSSILKRDKRIDVQYIVDLNSFYEYKGQ